ncbi:Hydrogenase maturation factor HypB [Methanimicrococcus sp. At1]|uniref:Hydrogenase maturation factor HypB n=1 Tax=Methanimicrococcus hacksteinii TaxID=3028293 RepID=A0ABU3VMS4_9EURY|nr:hydrogenase nickel incorporation protein HypB [Methanimicrococcus sp. At1]MDV0444692.1 Hydrogenase maturation factor HypB [Methanimicrococcus sp. At1]
MWNTFLATGHIINIGHDVFKENRKLADKNREILKKAGVFSVNIMGAIGSGKTTLIEEAIKALDGKYKIAVIAGDVIADMDASRFEKLGVKTIPANTGKECHLDAHIVNDLLKKNDLSGCDILFIENVGNLICPTDFDLGEDMKIVVVSVSEGDDIVLKHPVIFKTSDMAVINKIDIAEAVGVDPATMVRDAKSLNENIPILLTSKKQEETVAEWVKTIENAMLEKKAGKN